MNQRNSVRAPRHIRHLLELLHTAIVVGSVTAVVYGLFDLFNVV